MTIKQNTVAPKAVALVTGKGSKARLDAFTAIAGHAYNAESGKALLLATLGKALGDTPTDDQVKHARLHCTIGIAAQRMPVAEFGKGVKAVDMPSRIAMVTEWVLNYQAPSKAVTGKTPSLSKGKVGWRTGVQNRIIRNAEDRASKYLAELGATEAKTEAVKNADKRAGKAPAPAANAPSHSELVKADTPVDGKAFAGQMLLMLSTALAYSNKNAGVVPMEFNAIAARLAELHADAREADKAYHIRLAADPDKGKPVRKSAKTA